MRHNDDIWADQKVRQEKYPPDRIAFLHSEFTAKQDAMIFQRYKEHKLTLFQAMREIGRNNYLDITEEQFLSEYRIIGYANTKAVDEYE